MDTRFSGEWTPWTQDFRASETPWTRDFRPCEGGLYKSALRVYKIAFAFALSLFAFYIPTPTYFLRFFFSHLGTEGEGEIVGIGPPPTTDEDPDASWDGIPFAQIGEKDREEREWEEWVTDWHKFE